MMGVICGLDGGVKGAGHQWDKYKLKLMRVSFLLDQFVLGGCADRGMAHLPFALSFRGLHPRGEKMKEKKKKNNP